MNCFNMNNMNNNFFPINNDNNNMMNNMNNMNNTNNEMLKPNAIITSNIQIDEVSKININSVLHIFSSLKCVQDWIKKLYSFYNGFFNQNENLDITRGLYNLFSTLYSENNSDSTNFISIYNKKINDLKVNPSEPIGFLHYLLLLISFEKDFNKNFGQPLPQFINNNNNEYTKQKFFEDFKKIENSFIKDNFCIILKYKKNSCENYKNFGCKQIINYDYKFNIFLFYYI